MKIAMIQGHPDPHAEHFGHALAARYRMGAESAGHEVRSIDVAKLDFPWIQSQSEWKESPPPPHIADAQTLVEAAQHLVILYPLWMGTLPAILKAFFEQLLRPSFAFERDERGEPTRARLKPKSARIIVTMGMPAFFYRWYFRSHSLKNLQHNILRFVGIHPIRSSLIGSVDSPRAEYRQKWLNHIEQLGRRGQ